MWEDIVIAVGNLILALSLIGTIRDEQKPPLTTSIPGVVVLLVFCIAQVSLELYLTTIITFCVAMMWAVIAWQRYRQGNIVIKKQ